MALNVAITFSDADVPELRVRQYVFEDALNGVFELRLDVLTASAELDLGKIIGHPVTVAFKDEPYLGKIHGLVRGVRQVSAEVDGDSKYEILVVPPLWLASRCADHRIFQDTTADEAVSQLLALYASRIPAPSVLASPGRPKREYRVQYGETDLDFVLRALAEEGLVAYFAYGDSSTDWTLTESTTFTDDGAPKVPFVPPTGTGGKIDGPRVSSMTITAGMETTAVTVRDYDLLKPHYVLEQSKETTQPLFTGEDPLERYEYLSGRFTAATEKQGKALATQFLEEARAERRVFECRTTFMLGAGGRFNLEHHPRADVNGQLFVVRSRCSVTEDDAGKPARLNMLVCIPAADPWRPRRRPKPRIHGTHLAFVVGNKAGIDEIDVDEHGRVKVEFRWDRRDLHEGKPTRYVRVSQGWAGLDYGFVMLPRVNEEVIVAYLDGDPDEPVIVGRLHNASNVAPLKLPDQKTQSIWKSKTSPGGGGYNEIMMEDKKGQELLRVHAHRDNLVTVGGSQTVDVGGNQKIHVKGTRDDHVEGAVTESFDTSLTTTIGGPQSTIAKDVTEKYASQSTTIDGKKHTKAGPVDEDFASLDTKVDGIHHEKYGSMGVEGGPMNWNVGNLGWKTGALEWSLSGAGHIKAPSFVIDAPDFHVTNAGSHKEIKGVWQTLHAAWNDTTSHKAAFLTSDTKGVIFEQKGYVTSVNVGVLKFDVTGVKVDMIGAKLANKGVNLATVAADIRKKGIMAVMAGIITLG
jgi:type VI secretion system secreted protein VgrG